MSNPIITQKEVQALVAKNGSLVERGNKYGVAAKPDRMFEGVLYASKLERDVAMHFDLQQRMGLVSKIERQVSVPLLAPGAKVLTSVGKYVIDFRVTYSDGRVVFVEAKGVETPLWRWKYRHFKIQYPDLELRVIKTV